MTWQPPEDDGASSISGYIIERKEAKSDRWLRINKNYVTMTRYRSSGLIEGLEYEYRITAVNSRGSGKPSESSAITVAMDPIGKVPLSRSTFSDHCLKFILPIRNIVVCGQSLQVLQSSPESQTAPGPRSRLPGCHQKRRVVLLLLVTWLRCKRSTRWTGHCATPHPPNCASTPSPTCPRVQSTSSGSSPATLVVVENLLRFLEWSKFKKCLVCEQLA